MRPARLASPALVAAVTSVAAMGACGENLTPPPEPPPALPACVPDRDGVITAAELPIAYGATAAYYASPAGATRPVDLVGASGRWDFSAERPDDVVIELGPTPLKDQWYAATFPAGQFVLDAGGGLDGIYHQDAQALWLDGTASRDMAPAGGRTLVHYPAPVALLRFPLTGGDAYTSEVDIADGVIAGLPFVGADTVEVDVTAGEALDVPYVRFSPVLRVRTNIVRTPSTGTPVVNKRTTLFLFECFGEVTRAESAPGEPSPDFTTATYLRRFALGAAQGE